MIKTPLQIKKELDKTVIGQDDAKKSLATEIYKHYIRIENEYKLKEMGKEISKSNIIMTGNTGVGKTFLAQKMAKIIGVPLIITDVTTLTESGYVGKDISSLFKDLINEADGDVELAERGIIVLDELDKLGRRGQNPSTTKDVGGEGVQQELLKMLEGTVVTYAQGGGRFNPQGEMGTFNTESVLFIGMGSFENIEDIVAERLNIKPTSSSIGFLSSNVSESKELSLKELRSNINSNDLKQFGMIPELLGRFPKISNLLPLSKEDLIDIMKLNTGIIEEYKILFELQGKQLTFRRDTYEAFADISIKQNLGARGLKSIIETVMSDIMFNAPSETKKRYTITKEMVIGNYFKIANELSA